MSRISVSCELNEQRDYFSLFAKMREMGAEYVDPRVRSPGWTIRTSMTTHELKEALMPYLGVGDKLELKYIVATIASGDRG